MAGNVTWEPPAVVSPEEVLNWNEQILELPDNPASVREDVFRTRGEEVGAMEYWSDVSEVIRPTTPTLQYSTTPILP